MLFRSLQPPIQAALRHHALALLEQVRQHAAVAHLDALRQELLEAAVLMLFPIVPHIGEAIYAELKPGQNIATQRFPVCDPAALVQSEIELVLQINGNDMAAAANLMANGNQQVGFYMNFFTDSGTARFMNPGSLSSSGKIYFFQLHYLI